MPDFNIRSDSVNVEQIMDQIRARIREKRGVDYTEQQIQEELRSQYVIAYSPQNKLRDGAHRRVKLEIVNPELRKQKLQVEEYVTQLEKQLIVVLFRVCHDRFRSPRGRSGSGLAIIHS